MAGSVELDLHSFPRGSKSSKSCRQEALQEAGDRISIFQQKRSRGWWPLEKAGELTVRHTHTNIIVRALREGWGPHRTKHTLLHLGPLEKAGDLTVPYSIDYIHIY